MAVDICSPRISFSFDLKYPDCMPIECHRQRPDVLLFDSIDFDFCIDQTTSQNDHFSSADELFKNGKILPFEIKKITPISQKDKVHRIIQGSTFTDTVGTITHTPESKTQAGEIIIQGPTDTPKKHSLSSSKTNLKMEPDEIIQKKSLKEFLSICPDEEEEEKKQTSSSFAKIPFWQFGRSTSLNLESCKNSSVIRSLNFLSRSNSTGSVPNSNPNPNPNQNQTGVAPKVIKKHNSMKERPIKRTSSSSYSSNQYYYSFSSNSSSRKNYGNKVRINPILNIPQGCISRGSASLFGLTSFFCNARSKNKKS